MSAWTEAAIRDLEAELERLDQDIEAKRAGVEQAQAEYDAAVAEQAMAHGMLDWARKKHASTAVDEPAADEPAVALAVPPGGTAPVVAIVPPSQTELCLRVLAELGGEADTTAVRTGLKQAGYELSQSQVRSALKYLAGKKNPPVKATGNGVWKLTGSVAAVRPVVFSAAAEAES